MRRAIYQWSGSRFGRPEAMPEAGTAALAIRLLRLACGTTDEHTANDA
jgi:hypothetical protein